MFSLDPSARLLSPGHNAFEEEAAPESRRAESSVQQNAAAMQSREMN